RASHPPFVAMRDRTAPITPIQFELPVPGTDRGHPAQAGIVAAGARSAQGLWMNRDGLVTVAETDASQRLRRARHQNRGYARAVSTYDAVKDLPLEIESYALEPLVQEVAADFSLHRTVVVLRGGGEEGRGEEVDYD